MNANLIQMSNGQNVVQTRDSGGQIEAKSIMRVADPVANKRPQMNVLPEQVPNV